MKIDFKSGLKYFEDRFKNMNKLLKLFISLFIVACILLLTIYFWYIWAISPINKDSSSIKVVIPLGSGSSKISTILKNNHVIKSEFAFKTYIKLNNVSGLKAGTYSLKKSMSLKEIVSELKNGIFFDPESFNVTFLEGKTMRWFAKKIASVTNNSAEDVFNLLKNKAYINSLIDKYWFLTKDITNSDIYYPLEGYLFPDTYNFKNKDVTVEEIFETLLDQTGKVLEDYKDDILSSDYSVHEIFTMASIVEMEGTNSSNRPTIAGVFYNRLSSGMSLGSDVTTYYAFKVELNERDLYYKELNTYNPYNTRGPNMIGKFPVGPISSISRASLLAAIYPVKTDYLYFVADKNGKVYFSKTAAEHSATIKSIKDAGNWFTY